MKNPTNREIARACNVNSSTVSRALSDNRSIPEATRKRIQKVARGMGWKPNPLASAYMAHLRTTRDPSFQCTLGFLIDYPMPKDLKSLPGHIRRSFLAACVRASEYGYTIEPIYLLEPEMSPRRLKRRLQIQNIPGVLFCGYRHAGKVVEDFDWPNYSAVAIGRSMTDPMLDRVAVNIHKGSAFMLNKALSLGYRRIGVLVSSELDQRWEHDFLSSVAYARERLSSEQSIFTAPDFPLVDPDEAWAEIASWIKQTRLDLLIATTSADFLAGKLSWRVPEDIALISIDRAVNQPGLAGLDMQYEVQGELAVDLLVARITHNQRGIPDHPVLHLVDGVWIDGKTAPPRTKSRQNKAFCP